jgi:tRNA modification GTPase
MSGTVAAIATGNSTAGIGTIRISGDRAIEIAGKVFTAMDGTPLSALKGYRAKYGRVYSDGESFDNAVALVFRAPKSYTGEDVVELSVHGGILIVEKTLEAVFAAGAEPAQAGEFTKRAFLNGKIDLTQAESVASMISAAGEEALRASYSMLQGSLSARINEVLETLTDYSALMAAWVDYPDEDIPELDEDTLRNAFAESRDKLKKLLDSYDSTAVMLEGVDTVIAGKPNAGKSTLMNMLSGYEKSIVTHIEGTTRDIIEDSVRLGSIVLHLSDTAGIRQSEDYVEAIGIQRALGKIESASLVLAVFDSASTLSVEDEMLIAACQGKRAIAVVNKTDLPPLLDFDKIKNSFDRLVYISAKNGDGAERLEAEIKALLGVENFDATQPLIANKRQKLCVQRAFEHLGEALSGLDGGLTYDAVNVMLDSAIDELLTLTGRKATEEVVNNIFSKFCVGK